jgi:hypothetical protein
VSRFETYIYWSGSTGRAFSQLLADRTCSGVKVHVLLDWVGGQLDESLIESAALCPARADASATAGTAG